MFVVHTTGLLLTVVVAVTEANCGKDDLEMNRFKASWSVADRTELLYISVNNNNINTKPAAAGKLLCSLGDTPSRTRSLSRWPDQFSCIGRYHQAYQEVHLC